jgi:hypothetical protein
MSAYTTADIASEAVMDIQVSPPLSPTAATFVPATQRDAAQSSLSPSTAEIAPGTTTVERPSSLSPKAPYFVPATTKSPDSPLSPHAAVYVPREPTPAPLPTSRFLLALMEVCEREIMQRIEALEQIELLPSDLR